MEAVLGDALVGRFAGVRAHSPLSAVEEGRDVLSETGADAVVAVGGGSAVVTARAATILLAEGRDARELCTRRGDDGQLKSPRLLAPKLLDGAAEPDAPADHRAVAAVEAVLGIPRRLRDVDVPREALALVASDAVDDWAITAVPRPVDRNALEDLLGAAW